jgi:hypothetical protein
MAGSAGAAVSALRASESQPILIPGEFAHFRILTPNRELDQPFAKLAALILIAGFEVLDR